MKYVLFILGVFCWIDWLPHLDQTLLNNFNNLIILLFCLGLIKNIKFLFPLSILQKILLVYLIFIILVTLMNGKTLPISNTFNLLIIVLILAKQISGTQYLFNGFVFGGFFTSLYMFLVIFDIINISDYSVLKTFNFGDYFINNKDLVISIGFTDKYNKLSYLLSILTYFVWIHLDLKSFFKYCLVALIVFLQIKTTGRGGLVVSILLIGYLSFSTRYKFLVLPFILSFFYLLLNSTLFEVMATRFTFENSSSVSRLNQYAYAIENFTDNMFFGIGYAPLNDFSDVTYIHNFFLNNLLMGGLLGFVLGFLIILLLLRRVLNSNMDKNLKFFLISLITIQSMFENFNIIIALGSYLLIWFLIADSKTNQRITLMKKHL